MSELDKVAAELGLLADDLDQWLFRQEVEEAGGPEEAQWLLVRRYGVRRVSQRLKEIEKTL